MWKTIFRFCWVERTFGTKLSVLLTSATAVPIILITHGIVQVADSKLIHNLQDKLQQNLNILEHEFAQIEQIDRTIAIDLGKSIQLAQLDLSVANLGTDRANEFEQLLNPQEQTEHLPSFYILMDDQGRTIAQRTRRIAALRSAIDLNSAAPAWSMQVSSSEPLTTIPMVKDVFQDQMIRSGSLLLNPDQLKQLGILEQANLGIQPQKIEGLPPEKQPAPLGTYDIHQGQMGLVVLAVQPIHLEGRFVGAALVGTLLNGNPRTVDRVKQETNVATATIFAKDWRVSTNVLLPDQQTRALGTRVAREVSSMVLDRGQPFQGKTNIVGQSYLTAYKPLYGYRSTSPSSDTSKPGQPDSAKPIGILYVGDPETQVRQTLTTLAWRGYGIGGGILLLVGLFAAPTARSLIASDSQIRRQTQQLQDTLATLQETQLQLVQTEKMSGLGQLVAGIAHEINNPIGFVHGNINHLDVYTQDLLQLVELYQQHYPEPKSAIVDAIDDIDLAFIQSDLPQIMSSIRLGTTRVKEIVLSLRNFSRMDEAEYKKVNLQDGIESTLVILRHRLKATDRRPEIQVLTQYDEIPTIECYAGQLNQVFMNILANAIDALDEHYDSTPGQPMIQIKTIALDRDWVAIHLSDNGAGIPPEIQQRLFDPFFTTKPVGKGTGLGLSISYQIVVDHHQGFLMCRSPEEGGTEFILKIPIRGQCV